MRIKEMAAIRNTKQEVYLLVNKDRDLIYGYYIDLSKGKRDAIKLRRSEAKRQMEWGEATEEEIHTSVNYNIRLVKSGQVLNTFDHHGINPGFPWTQRMRGR